MFDIFYEFATDEALEIEGVVVNLDKDAWIKVARLGNDRYTEALLKLGEKHASELEAGGTKAQAVDRKLTIEAMAEHVLVGFGGLGLKGEALEYSPENAVKLLSIKDFRRRVIAEANKIEHFRVKREAQVRQD
jgi:hypothetical protein